MKDIKLVALDMDGTLLNSKKEKPAEFIPAAASVNAILQQSAALQTKASMS